MMINKLVERISNVGESYLMFSGGLDSCAILGAAIKANIKVTPVWIDNGFGRADEDDIIRQANNMGGEKLKIIRLTPTVKVTENPVDRCYYCKGQIISAIKKLGAASVIMDGTTASDTGYRPGRRALKEYGVISPLAELEISSAQAKEMALSMGADKDIADLESCMATRINYNNPLTPESIRVVREIERVVISKTNDYNVRCRIDDPEHIRIELSAEKSFAAISDGLFRDRLLAVGQQVAMFTTIDLKPSRPNAYDNKLKK